MQHRLLPGLGRTVSVLGAGCWTVGGPAANNGIPIGWDDVDPDIAYAALRRAHELGITLFDTADVYGLGRSERLLGRLLREIDRDQVIISSKVGYFAGTGAHPYHPRQMCHQLATTLDNLDTDRLDVYFLHSTDFGEHDRYLPGAINLLAAWCEQGLIGAVGMRAPHAFAEEWAACPGPRQAETARFLHLFDRIRPNVLTARYNLLSPLYRPDETDIFTFARRYQVGVLIKQVLAQGLLLGAHDPDRPRRFSATDHRHTDPRFAPGALRRLADTLAPLRARHGDHPAALARIALRYAMQHAPDSIVLTGFRNPEQIQTNITCLGDPLTDEEITEIRDLLHPRSPA
ncbi:MULTISPECIES: aldo/keto reductase [unclassified Crossiella]|uniref:aldo/keto reductase n=1 Tax=unclassified Crossiella TaxID=2620835 RepID=UPI001FFEB15F|nr:MULTISPECIES: aldo/keto reductase [unclassified Crossiella]MCK2245263.1 aldo/keto reductase [Crossiella sp. S99.2]MCK2258916.1 aldo/keto reductase [Crossiella sp. S99.1]